MLKVLIGVDDSAESRDAVTTAFLFFGPDAEYIIAAVSERIPYLFSASIAGGSAATARQLEEEFDVAARVAEQRAAEASESLPTSAEVTTEFGRAGHALCRLASEHAVDAVVIGSQDKTVWQRILDPSVGRYLIDNAPCPVLVVR